MIIIKKVIQKSFKEKILIIFTIYYILYIIMKRERLDIYTASDQKLRIKQVKITDIQKFLRITGKIRRIMNSKMLLKKWIFDMEK